MTNRCGQPSRAARASCLLDEFQDVNLAQIELAQLLAGSEQNLFAVGDPDQAIYRFRGASSAAFQEFARRFPKTKRVTLIENQRSRTPVLKCAYAVIRCNPSVAPAGFEREPLESARDLRDQQQGELLPRFPVEIVTAKSDEQEAFDVAGCIEELRRVPGKRRDGTRERRSPQHRRSLPPACSPQPAGTRVGGTPYPIRGGRAQRAGDARGARPVGLPARAGFHGRQWQLVPRGRPPHVPCGCRSPAPGAEACGEGRRLRQRAGGGPGRKRGSGHRRGSLGDGAHEGHEHRRGADVRARALCFRPERAPGSRVREIRPRLDQEAGGGQRRAVRVPRLHGPLSRGWRHCRRPDRRCGLGPERGAAYDRARRQRTGVRPRLHAAREPELVSHQLPRKALRVSPAAPARAGGRRRRQGRSTSRRSGGCSTLA